MHKCSWMKELMSTCLSQSQQVAQQSSTLPLMAQAETRTALFVECYWCFPVMARCRKFDLYLQERDSYWICLIEVSTMSYVVCYERSKVTSIHRKCVMCHGLCTHWKFCFWELRYFIGNEYNPNPNQYPRHSVQALVLCKIITNDWTEISWNQQTANKWYQCMQYSINITQNIKCLLARFCTARRQPRLMRWTLGWTMSKDKESIARPVWMIGVLGSDSVL